MPGKKDLAKPADIVFIYDGSISGFYCCVYESVYSRQLPAEIFTEDDFQPTLYDQRFVVTEESRAARVRASIAEKICPRALELTETVFLSCMQNKELSLLRFLLLGYKQGRQTPYMLGHPEVAPVLAAAKHLGGEAHLLLGFVRFADYDGILGATITPKNFILPFIANHFISRFSGEDFMIYDKTHKAALVYQNRKKSIITMADVQFPEADEKEKRYQELWKQFYRTIAIEARENPKCRMTHMPKRYWENMTEMQEYL